MAASRICFDAGMSLSNEASPTEIQFGEMLGDAQLRDLESTDLEAIFHLIFWRAKSDPSISGKELAPLTHSWVNSRKRLWRPGPF